jgi:hypothetical protein
VPKVVKPAQPGRVEDKVVDELLERCLERLRRHIHDPGENVRDETATDDGPGACGGLCLGRTLRDPGDDGILDGVGDGGLPNGPSVRSPLRTQRAEELLDMERDPVCPPEHGRNDLSRRREPRVEEQGRDEGGLRLGQRREPDFLRDPLGDEPCPPVPKARAGRHLLGPVVAGQQELPVARLARQLPDDLEAHVVGPLQVLERQHRRARQRDEDPLDEPHHQASTLDVLGRSGRIAQIEQLPAEVGEWREPGHRPRQVEDRSRRHVAVLGGEGPLCR